MIRHDKERVFISHEKDIQKNSLHCIVSNKSREVLIVDDPRIHGKKHHKWQERDGGVKRIDWGQGSQGTGHKRILRN